ncbi:hypothetical protein CI109_103422 [Kwoniella shandongensis]|uniref:Uncharacterized protein n=1 Tax=Kwoniella shandongensis TaxID=1734106 RepID=A0A5M6BYC6_9TREE|nr:uncharacterized protein CI109_004503 [Kwoniella shandongensis]KAA5527210.1 hypothetical protein CI109_004503 [Kwoniella shandongensis]
MFPTGYRSRHRGTVDAARAYQKESPPVQPEDEETSYGVKSMSDWGGSVMLPTSTSSSMHELAVPTLSMHETTTITEDEGVQDRDREDRGDGDPTPDLQQEDQVGLGITPPFQSYSGAGTSEVVGPNTDWTPVTERTTLPSASPEADTSHGLGLGGLEHRVIPPSPEDTIHPFESSPSQPHEHHHDNHYHHHASHNQSHEIPFTPPMVDSPYFIHPSSEPSSPASFTSMPSYVASLSSLSRTSSASVSVSSPLQHHHRGTIVASSSASHHHGGEELVLPSMNLPEESLSLHMSLPKMFTHTHAEGEGEGVTMALVGSREDTERVLRGVKERVRLVDLGKGVVGVLDNDGKVDMRILTGLNQEQVRNKVRNAYHTLNGLLHPRLSGGEMESDLRRLVLGYATRSDWIHLVVKLDSQHEQDDLDDLVPVIHPVSAALNISPLQLNRLLVEPEPTPQHNMTGPTPRLSAETQGYFAPREYTPSPPASRQGSPESYSDPSRHQDEAVQVICSTVDKPSSNTVLASVDAFLAWRARATDTMTQHLHLQPQFEGSSGQKRTLVTTSSSMTSASSSSYGPMPTVARAQGGGEWEATLSRRIAQRRESETRGDRSSGNNGVSGRGKRRRSFGERGGKEAMSSSTKYHHHHQPLSPSHPHPRKERSGSSRDCLPPLFPTSSGSGNNVSSVGLGLGGLIEKTFGKSVQQWRKNWKGVAVACAVVVVVGWGCWVGSRRV